MEKMSIHTEFEGRTRRFEARSLTVAVLQMMRFYKLYYTMTNVDRIVEDLYESGSAEEQGVLIEWVSEGY